jgi:hypothetical protein
MKKPKYWPCNEGLSAKLLGVLSGQALPSPRPHGVCSGDASDSAHPPVADQALEADVPARGDPGNEAGRDAVPQRQARAAAKGFELSTDVMKLKHLESLGSRYSCFGDLPRCDPAEPYHGAGRIEAAINLEGRPLVQMRWSVSASQIIDGGWRSSLTRMRATSHRPCVPALRMPDPVHTVRDWSSSLRLPIRS